MLLKVGGENADTTRIVWIFLTIDSLHAAFGDIRYSGPFGSVSATQGSGRSFQVFAASDIGGGSLKGKRESKASAKARVGKCGPRRRGGGSGTS